MLLAIWLAKLTNLIIKTFKLGAGYTWPGQVGLAVLPDFFERVSFQLPKKVIIVTGTNGKTTTSKLISHILENQDLRVLHNYTGANLLNGIASAILVNSTFFGNLPYDVAVFEADELTLPKLLQHVSPSILVLLNLSRDQLDRHWETDIVLDKWVSSISKLPTSVKLLLSIDQPEFAKVAEKFNGSTLYFNADTNVLSTTHLYGDFNAKNINAALLAASLLDISKSKAVHSLSSFDVAYGRGEKIKYKEKDFQIFLAKNPASVNANLKMLQDSKVDYDSILFILNDKIPDGHDVSWIYDVVPEMLKSACADKQVFVSGTRAGDMAVRLNYAGVSVDDNCVSYNLFDTLTSITSAQGIHNLVVLPNYSAMLELRKILTGASIL